MKNNIFLKSLSFLLKNTPNYKINDDDIGFVTAGDSNVFGGIQVIFNCLKNKVNFICFDIGLTESQIKWAGENGLKLIKFQIDENIKKINKWQTYLKPFFINQSPYEYTIWIDTDCVPTGNLLESDFIKNKKTFFIQHWLKQKHLLKNKKELYDLYPVKNNKHIIINAGVFGINKKENFEILQNYMNIIDNGFKNPSLLDNLCNWDEGALNWAIQKDQKNNLVYDDYRYNCFSQFLPVLCTDKLNMFQQKIYIFDKICSPVLFFAKLLQNKDVFIYHFSTCMQNNKKYWSVWE